MIKRVGLSVAGVALALALVVSPASGQIRAGLTNLATMVTGRLPFANLTQGSARSVLGVTGASTADVASIASSSDGDVLRRASGAVGFGSIPAASISDLATATVAFSNKSGAISQWTNDSGYRTSANAVTSLAGTANQISASASTGSVTLSIPTNPVFSGTALTFPGLLSIASGKTLTVSNSITVAGTDGVVITTPTTSFAAARTDATAQNFLGAIGINVASPSLRLEVTAPSGLSAAKFLGASGGGLYIGNYNASYGGIWSAAVTPATNNYAFIATSTSTLISAPSGGGVALGIGDSVTLLNVNATTVTFPLGLLVLGADVIVARDTGSSLTFRNGASAMSVNIANTITTPGTAGEWFTIDWQTTANVVNLQAVRGSSSGTARVMTLSYGGLKASPVPAITIPITSGPIVFGGAVKGAGFQSSDGTDGLTATCTLASITTFVVKNGLVTACS